MHVKPIAAAVAGAAAIATALAGAPAAPAATTSSTSTNWAGYVASRAGVSYRHVTATWTVPSVTCQAGRRSYSANWIGLGGYHSTSRALEQIGSASSCDADGRAYYSSWYELVPQAFVRTHLTVAAGDVLSAGVDVSNGVVRLRLVNHTSGAVFSTRVRASAIDVTSADWIVEAPSACSAGGACATLPLADFQQTGFSGARATTAAGHAGTISDPAWASNAISLVGGRGRRGPEFEGQPIQRAGLSRGAAPGPLSPAGDAFSVTFASQA
jgi:Peptidase A4 family